LIINQSNASYVFYLIRSYISPDKQLKLNQIIS